MARLVATMRANPQCKSLDIACDLFLVLKAAYSDEKNLHDTRIQLGLHEYVDGNVHKVVGRLFTNIVPAVIWDRNKTVTAVLSGQQILPTLRPSVPPFPIPCTPTC